MQNSLAFASCNRHLVSSNKVAFECSVETVLLATRYCVKMINALSAQRSLVLLTVAAGDDLGYSAHLPKIDFRSHVR